MLLAVLIAMFVFISAGPAVAHGISGDALGKSVPDFVPIGMEHMLLGWDHLLFIVAVVVLAGAARRAAKLISLFAAGHSLTLIVATIAEWRINPELVDVVIAMSIAYVGVVGVRGAPYNWRAFGVGVFGFGLVHGLGLSTRFQDLGLPDDGRIPRLVAFNVGIELGQLLAIAGVVVVGLLLLDMSGIRERMSRPSALRGVNAVVIAVGVCAAGVLAARGGDSDPYADLVAADTNCSTQAREAPLVLDGQHPEGNFFEPGEAYRDIDFGHVVGDGYVVIRYRGSLTEKQRQGIEDFVLRNRGVVAGAVKGQPNAIEVVTQKRTLSCIEPDVATMARFGELWLKKQRG